MGQRLFNANDGVTGRDGGPYLDVEEAKRAEDRRAAVEGREPNYDNMGSTAGIQLNTAAQMIHTIGVNQPSSAHNFNAEAARAFDSAADDDESLLTPFGEIPDEALTNKSQDEVDSLAPSEEEEAPAEESTGADLFTSPEDDK